MAYVESWGEQVGEGGMMVKNEDIALFLGKGSEDASGRRGRGIGKEGQMGSIEGLEEAHGQ